MYCSCGGNKYNNPCDNAIVPKERQPNENSNFYKKERKKEERMCRERNERTLGKQRFISIQTCQNQYYHFFKKSDINSGSNVESANNPDDASYVNSVNNINHNDAHPSVNKNNSGPSLTHSSIYRPPKSYAFPKTAIGNRERPCQYQWFEDYKWLHYDERKDCVFCYFCIKHQAKLSVEHNKDPAYISTGFRNWKKTPKCFKEHEQSKCHTAALVNEVVVPKCADVAEMHDNELIKQRKMERQYLKIIMESLQYLGWQGIPLRGKEEGNDNFTQLLLLLGKDHPFIIERLTSTGEHVSLYVQHNY